MIGQELNDQVGSARRCAVHGGVAPVISGVYICSVLHQQLEAFDEFRFGLVFAALETGSHAGGGGDHRSIVVIRGLVGIGSVRDEQAHGLQIGGAGCPQEGSVAVRHDSGVLRRARRNLSRHGPVRIRAVVKQVFDESDLVELIGDGLARAVALVVQISHFDGQEQGAFLEAGLVVNQKRG